MNALEWALALVLWIGAMWWLAAWLCTAVSGQQQIAEQIVKGAVYGTAEMAGDARRQPVAATVRPLEERVRADVAARVSRCQLDLASATTDHEASGYIGTVLMFKEKGRH